MGSEELDWHPKVYKRTRRISAIENNEWQILRDDVLRRDKWTCQRCLRKMRAKRYLTAHHIVPRDKGGGNYMENLITLCTTCHDIVEMNEFRSRAEIVGSFEKDHIYEKPPTENNNAPDWHTWVYGGCRNPYLDQWAYKIGNESNQI